MEPTLVVKRAEELCVRGFHHRRASHGVPAVSFYLSMTAATAKAELTAPLPAEVDERAEIFSELEKKLAEAKAEVKTAQEKLAAKELELIELVRSFGGPHASKSKILHGILWEMVATFSQYTVQDSAAVERFRLALKEARQTRLLKKIFKEDKRYTFDGVAAAGIIKTEKLSAELLTLLLQCAVTKDKAPSLDVRLKKKTQ